MKQIMNRITLKATAAVWEMKDKTKEALSNERGDFYISDGVKIIIAVVLGALQIGRAHV